MEGKKRPWPNETTLGIEEDDCRGNWDQWYITKSYYHRNKANESEYQRNFRQVYGILFNIETTYDVSRLGAWNIIMLLAGAFVTVKSLEFIFYIIFHLFWCLKPWGYHCSGRYHTLGDERESKKEIDQYWDVLYAILPHQEDLPQQGGETLPDGEPNTQEDGSNVNPEPSDDQPDEVQLLMV